MQHLIEQQPAWLLHSRPFRDTSLLLDFLTLDHGRLSAVARGARGPRSKVRALLQPFQPLSLSVAGRGELLNLRTVEPRAAMLPLSGERLFSGLYLNELLVRILAGHESERALFELYETTLAALSGGAALEPLLRGFELTLLDILGYGLQLTHAADSDEAIDVEGWYYLGDGGGLIRQQEIRDAGPAEPQLLFPGAELLLISTGDFSAESTRRHAKRLLRQALQQHMSDRPLASRELFRQQGR